MILRGALSFNLLESKDQKRNILVIGEIHQRVADLCEDYQPSSRLYSPEVSDWVISLVKENPKTLFDLYLEIPYYRLVKPLTGESFINREDLSRIFNMFTSKQIANFVKHFYYCINPQYKNLKCKYSNLRVHAIDPRTLQAQNPFFHYTDWAVKEIKEFISIVDKKTSITPSEFKKLVDQFWTKFKQKVIYYVQQAYTPFPVTLYSKTVYRKNTSGVTQTYSQLASLLGVTDNNPVLKEIKQVEDLYIRLKILTYYQRIVQDLLKETDNSLRHLRTFLKMTESPLINPYTYKWNALKNHLETIYQTWLYKNLDLLDVFFLARFFTRKIDQIGFAIFYGGDFHAINVLKVLKDLGYHHLVTQTSLTNADDRNCLYIPESYLKVIQQTLKKFPYEIKEENKTIVSSVRREETKKIETQIIPTQEMKKEEIKIISPLTFSPLQEIKEIEPKAQERKEIKTVPTFHPILQIPHAPSYPSSSSYFLHLLQKQNWKKRDVQALLYDLEEKLKLPFEKSLRNFFKLLDEYQKWKQMDTFFEKIKNHSLTLHAPLQNSSHCIGNHPDQVEKLIKLIQAHHWRGYELANKLNLLIKDDPSLGNTWSHNDYRVGNLSQPQSRVPKWRGMGQGQPVFDKPNLTYKIIQDACPLLPRFFKNFS